MSEKLDLHNFNIPGIDLGTIDTEQYLDTLASLHAPLTEAIKLDKANGFATLEKAGKIIALFVSKKASSPWKYAGVGTYLIEGRSLVGTMIVNVKTFSAAILFFDGSSGSARVASIAYWKAGGSIDKPADYTFTFDPADDRSLATVAPLLAKIVITKGEFKAGKTVLTESAQTARQPAKAELSAFVSANKGTFTRTDASRGLSKPARNLLYHFGDLFSDVGGKVKVAPTRLQQAVDQFEKESPMEYREVVTESTVESAYTALMAVDFDDCTTFNRLLTEYQELVESAGQKPDAPHLNEIADFITKNADGFKRTDILNLINTRAYNLFKHIANEYPDMFVDSPANRGTLVYNAEAYGDIYAEFAKLERSDDTLQALLPKSARTTVKRAVSVRPNDKVSGSSDNGANADTEFEEIEKLAYEEQLRDMALQVRLVAAGATPLLIIAGSRGGIGKTYGVQQVLEKELGLNEGTGYQLVKGTASPSGLYSVLYHNREPGSIIMMDDADAIFNDQEGRNILKAATDSGARRKMSWLKKSPNVYNKIDDDPEWNKAQEAEGKVPASYYFAGSVIIISNLNINVLDKDGALRTRGFALEMNPTDQEIINFIEKLLPVLSSPNSEKVSLEVRLEIFETLKKSTRQGGLSIRSMVRAIGVYGSLDGVSKDDKMRIIMRYA